MHEACDLRYQRAARFGRAICWASSSGLNRRADNQIFHHAARRRARDRVFDARDPKARKWARGMPGGPDNPLGARAHYLYQGNVDTLYRIHGTVEPWTIGSNVSSGCIRLINQDVMDLFERVRVGTVVKVLERPAAPAV